ncbi:Ribosomal protein S23/S29, mitochondrial [Corchorus olitorius]|uniref:Small ribosomal subunit protein mS29 n=1 Tax=Corchorus olitorius TaxID=93759 RepID=A0A1R3K5H6_9ROSI|nr:Ribosomal protein S23/S29, mitochondrial [Corchorus olitorius]
MLRSIVNQATLSKPGLEPIVPQLTHLQSKLYSSKNPKTMTKSKKANAKSKSKFGDSAAAGEDIDSGGADDYEASRARRLAEDENDPSLDVGHNGRPLFTSTPSLSQLTHKDTCSYMKFSEKGLKEVLPEGLPMGMVTEFKESMRPSLLVRQSFLDLRDNFRRIVDPPMWTSNTKGEGAGAGRMQDVDSMALPEGSTLYDLVQLGIKYSHAAVGVVVRLRKELSLVKDVPVLFAIDQYNNWFTFSEYEEPVAVRSCRPVHARELAMVKAFRSMMHDDMMVGAFSHSTAVGKLRKDLPDVPVDARVNLPRYTLDEAATVCHYYLRQRLIRKETFTEENWKKVYYVSNGNGSEMRWLVPLMR